MASKTERGGGMLAAVERFGNRLPDPVYIFVMLIGAVVGLSAIGAWLGWSAQNPLTGELLATQNLLEPDTLRRFLVEMPRTLTSFAPLGAVLVVMLGAGVAERSGLLAALMRASVRNAPRALLTPAVVFTGIMANHAADAAYVVFIPLAALLFAAAGRHPLAGLAAAFAGTSGGFSANLFPGQLDAVLLGITQESARLLDPEATITIAGNWYFILALAGLFTPLAWWVTDRIVEPRLGAWAPNPGAVAAADTGALTPIERRGLATAGVGAAIIASGMFAMAFPPLWGAAGAPLVDAEALAAGRLAQAWNPLFQSLVAGFFLLFLVCGVLYGAAAKTIHSHRDVIRMASEAMADLGPYIVLAFVAAHFVALFDWSRLGAITAIASAGALRDAGLPAAALLVLLVFIAALVNLVIGSAGAKWALLAPIVVPMFMLLGVSPEATTAAYRVGDGVTNIITPLMVYFPLVLTFCRRWNPDFGMGSLIALMLPYSLWFLIGGVALTLGWMALGVPVGPGAAIQFSLPESPAF